MAVTVAPATGLTMTTDHQAGGTDTVAEQDTFSGTDVHSASATVANLQPTSEDVSSSTSDLLSGTNQLTGTEQFSGDFPNLIHIVGNLTPTESIDAINNAQYAENSQDSFSQSEMLNTDGTNTDTSTFGGQFNIPVLYDLQLGKTSVTDPATGITTTDAVTQPSMSKRRNSPRDN